MDVSSFYAIVSGINFTLLGLWWVAIKDRPEIVGRSPIGRRMAYLVSLQFVVPGTIALFGQVAPDVPAVWRISFGVAAVAGASGVLLLARSLHRAGAYTTVLRPLPWVAVPLYLAVAVIAVFDGLPDALNVQLSSIEIEGLLLTLLIFLGVHLAWVVLIAPPGDGES